MNWIIADDSEVEARKNKEAMANTADGRLYDWISELYELVSD